MRLDFCFKHKVERIMQEKPFNLKCILFEFGKIDVIV